MSTPAIKDSTSVHLDQPDQVPAVPTSDADPTSRDHANKNKDPIKTVSDTK